MDVTKMYKDISKLVSAQFDITRNIHHHGDKGTIREDILRSFLLDGRLPKKYAIGHGEVISPNSQCSKSMDLIIYNQMEYAPIFYSESSQIMPVEVVAGAIESKSSLTKEEFEKALENIKSLKELQYDGTGYEQTGSGGSTFTKSKPFGIIFGYSLSGNSLTSLKGNLVDWESANPHECWPNLVVVLNEGIIVHRKDNAQIDDLLNTHISSASKPIVQTLRDDTVSDFYLKLLHLLNSTFLGNFSLESYFGKPNIPPFLEDILHSDNTNVQIVEQN